MEIKDIQGNILIDALVTEQAVKVDELMKQHSITLSWVSVTDEQLPLGAYIEHEGVRYSLLAPYNPEQSDEATYTYKPVFEHPIMRWQHIPFFFYTYSEGKVISKELDWSLTDNPANFMRAVCDAILNETGEDWSYEISADLPASASLSFSNTDIFSALNAIAGVFKTEWWFDYANKIVHLSKAAYGDAVTLEVGQNIGVPSKNQSKEGYYTRFYAFGSTRNIEQSYAGSNVNSIVNRRLTLNPEKYPNGYIDIREGLTESEILVKTLVFDDIYPRSSLTISDVKVRLMWRLDDNSEKVQIGTDSEGNPVYDQYAIWYFKIPELSFSKDMLIEGKALSVHFNSGALNGREFELTYHDTAKEVTTSDGTSIQVEVGDYEINFIEEGTYIIPAITGLIPMEGDSVTLFNIVMPEEYKVSAYEELEQEVRKEIAKQGEDRNNYTFGSNKVAFFESNPNLAVGRNVLYKNGSTTLATRVIRLETQLDYAFEQKITIGNEQIKGNTQTLKEEVVNANQSIDLLAAINENTEAFQQSLQRTQKAVLDSLAKWGDMWVLDPANGAVRTRYNLIVEGGGAFGKGQESEDTPSEVNIAIKIDGRDILYKPIDGVITIPAYPENTGLDESELEKYLTTNQYAKKSDIPSLSGYATEQWVLDKNYALASDLTALRTDFDNLNTLLNGNVGGIIDTWNEVVSFLDGYSQSDDLASILSGMNSDIANRVLIEDFEKLEGSVTEIAGYFTNGSANNALKLGGQLPSYYATADALNTHITAFNTYKTTTDNRLNKLEALWYMDDEGNVHTTHNIVVEGGGAFGMGAESGGSTGGLGSVTIKTEGGIEYKSDASGVVTVPNWITASAIPTNNNQLTNGAGYITSSALNGYAKLTDIPASLPASDVYAWAKAASKPTYTFSEITGKPTTLGGYGITDALSVNGGTIDGATTYPLIVSNSADTLVGTVFSANSANRAMILAGGDWHAAFVNPQAGYKAIGVRDDGTPFYGDSSTQNTLLHSGNYSSYALPLSGGTFNFPSWGSGATSNPRIGRFDRDAGSLVFQVGTSDIFDIVDSGWVNTMLRVASDEFSYYGNSIIHSGNIGSQSVNYASSASYTTYTKYLEINNSLHVGSQLQYMQLSSQNEYGDNPTGSHCSIIKMGHGDADDYYNRTLAFDFWSNKIYTRNRQEGIASGWDEIAFISSNVASATKLQTTRSIWGQSFDGSGDVWGRINIRDSAALYHYTPDGSGLLCYIGHDYRDPFAHIYNFRSGSSIRVNDDGNICVPYGNVLIGTTTNNGHKLQISGGIWADGAIQTTSAIPMYFYGTNVTCGLYPNSWISSDGVNNRLWLYNDNNLAIYGKYIELKSHTYIDNRLTINFGVDATDPTTQAIAINAAEGATSFAGWPGIGFHIPGITYATIKFGSDTCFHFMNYALSGWVDVKVGNLVATGGGAFGSDIRYKDILSFQQLDLETIANAPLFTFKWTDREDKVEHLGTSAQYWLDTQFKDAVNITNPEFFHLDYGALAVGIGISVAREVKVVKTEVEQLRNKVKDLETRLSKYEQVWHN